MAQTYSEDHYDTLASLHGEAQIIVDDADGEGFGRVDLVGLAHLEAREWDYDQPIVVQYGAEYISVRDASYCSTRAQLGGLAHLRAVDGDEFETRAHVSVLGESQDEAPQIFSLPALSLMR